MTQITKLWHYYWRKKQFTVECPHNRQPQFRDDGGTWSWSEVAHRPKHWCYIFERD